jgi:hypothetical protein
MATKRKKPIFTKRTLIAVGILSALVGTYFIAGDKIKSLFKPDAGEDQNDQTPSEVTPGQTPALIAPGSPAPKTEGIDIDKKLRSGSKGNEVKRLQFIINSIAGMRGQSSYKTPAGYVVKFPINPDGEFGSNTQAGAYFSFDVFNSQGYVTLDQARKKLAYIAGYRNKPFPSELVGTKNYSKYQESYKAGQIQFGQDDRLKNIGAFVNPFNP